jgi:predicted site-specific integrase-resolvase
MSMFTTMLLFEKYGPRMSLEQLGEALGLASGTLHARLAQGKLDLPTYVDGKHRFADTRDVAEYLDRLRDQARQAMPV